MEEYYMGKIRHAKIEDAEQIYKLIEELEGTSLNKPLFLKVYLNNLSNPQVHYYVYDNNKAINGFVSMHIQLLLHHTSKIAEIQELIVCKELQGRGIGKQLFEKVIATAKENECAQVEVCCNQKRKLSHIFYQKMGMQNNHFKFSLSI